MSLHHLNNLCYLMKARERHHLTRHKYMLANELLTMTYRSLSNTRLKVEDHGIRRYKCPHGKKHFYFDHYDLLEEHINQRFLTTLVSDAKTRQQLDIVDAVLEIFTVDEILQIQHKPNWIDQILKNGRVFMHYIYQSPSKSQNTLPTSYYMFNSKAEDPQNVDGTIVEIPRLKGESIETRLGVQYMDTYGRVVLIYQWETSNSKNNRLFMFNDPYYQMISKDKERNIKQGKTVKSIDGGRIELINEEVGNQNETILTTNEAVVVQIETIATANEEVGEQNESIPTTNEELVEQNETIPTTNEELAEQNGTIPTTNEELVEQNESIPTTNEEVAEQNESIPTTNEEVAEQNESIPTANEEVAEQNETIPTANGEVVEQSKTIPTAKSVECMVL